MAIEFNGRTQFMFYTAFFIWPVKQQMHLKALVDAMAEHVRDINEACSMIFMPGIFMHRGSRPTTGRGCFSWRMRIKRLRLGSTPGSDMSQTDSLIPCLLCLLWLWEQFALRLIHVLLDGVATVGVAWLMWIRECGENCALCSASLQLLVLKEHYILSHLSASAVSLATLASAMSTHLAYQVDLVRAGGQNCQEHITHFVWKRKSKPNDAVWTHFVCVWCCDVICNDSVCASVQWTQCVFVMLKSVMSQCVVTQRRDLLLSLSLLVWCDLMRCCTGIAVVMCCSVLLWCHAFTGRYTDAVWMHCLGMPWRDDSPRTTNHTELSFLELFPALWINPPYMAMACAVVLSAVGLCLLPAPVLRARKSRRHGMKRTSTAIFAEQFQDSMFFLKHHYCLNLLKATFVNICQQVAAVLPTGGAAHVFGQVGQSLAWEWWFCCWQKGPKPSQPAERLKMYWLNVCFPWGNPNSVNQAEQEKSEYTNFRTPEHSHTSEYTHESTICEQTHEGTHVAWESTHTLAIMCNHVQHTHTH